jgi:hypothetical protein
VTPCPCFKTPISYPTISLYSPALFELLVSPLAEHTRLIAESCTLWPAVTRCHQHSTSSTMLSQPLWLTWHWPLCGKQENKELGWSIFRLAGNLKQTKVDNIVEPCACSPSAHATPDISLSDITTIRWMYGISLCIQKVLYDRNWWTVAKCCDLTDHIQPDDDNPTNQENNNAFNSSNNNGLSPLLII